MKTRGRKKGTIPVAEQASSPKVCTHAACREVGRLVKIRILSRQKPFPTSLSTRILAALPLLLCTRGEWPPTLPEEALKALLEAFAAVCVQQKSTGFIGQELPGYGKLAAQARESA